MQRPAATCRQPLEPHKQKPNAVGHVARDAPPGPSSWATEATVDLKPPPDPPRTTVPQSRSGWQHQSTPLWPAKARTRPGDLVCVCERLVADSRGMTMPCTMRSYWNTSDVLSVAQPRNTACFKIKARRPALARFAPDKPVAWSRRRRLLRKATAHKTHESKNRAPDSRDGREETLKKTFKEHAMGSVSF